MNYSGFEVVQVDVGTRITDTQTGQTEVVEESNYVMAGRYVYCSPAAYTQLKDHINKHAKPKR